MSTTIEEINIDEVVKQLKKYREENKMSQKEFADLIGLNHSTICKWECGEQDPPISKIKDIMRIIGIKKINIVLPDDMLPKRCESCNNIIK